MISMRAALADAKSKRVALGHFNFSDLAALSGIVAAARRLQVPVAVGVSEGEREFVGVRQAARLVQNIREETGLPLILNADHTHSVEKAEAAARAGFDEILFDGSGLPFEQNLRETRRAVEAIKSIDPEILVEGEIGYIGTSSAILDEVPAGVGPLTTPEEAREFVAVTGIDVLSPAVGNMHGLLRSMVTGESKKRLDIERIAHIHAATPAFLTLHGASGTHDDDLRRAIRSGINLVHINTEIRVAWRHGLESAFARHPDEVAPYKLLPAAVETIAEIVVSRLRLFNSP
jgi:fructose-bisphosphate aldolase, class II